VSVAPDGNCPYACSLASCKRTIAPLPIALLLFAASCGGSGSKGETAGTRGAGGATGAGSAAGEPSSAPTTPSGSRPKGRKQPTSNDAKSRSGGAAPPRSRSREALKHDAKRPEKPVQKKGNEQGSNDAEPTSTIPPPPPRSNGRAGEVLARKARRVCQTLGIDALARKYNVEPTAEAVASAYAASYPPIFQAAVRAGCRSAFPA
jgi:hypothetical protein